MPEGIKEVSEVFVGLNKLSLVIIKLAKDGIQLSDVFELGKALQSDPDYLEAVDGISKCVAEIKDLDVNEGMQLAMIQLGFIPKLIDSFRKKPE